MTSKSLYRVVYASSSKGVVTPEVLSSILATARRENSLCDVTGMLLFHDGCFFQVLEGPEAAVRSVFERIRLDGRHLGLVTLESRNVSHRAFADWSMGFIGADNLTAQQRAGLVDLTRFIDGGRDIVLTGDAAVAMHIESYLNTFREFAI